MQSQLYNYQVSFLTSLAPKRLVLKSRQIGISTVVALEAVIECIENNNYLVLLLSIDERKSIDLLNSVRSLLKNIPNYETFIGETDTKTELRFVNGSRIISLTSNPNNARGYRANHIVFDEFAEMELVDEVFAAALPTISRGGKITIVGTPKGKANKLYELWTTATDFERYEIPWTECPDLTEENIDPIRQELSTVPGLFEQEYECSFDTFVGSLFTYSELENYLVPDIPQEGYTILGYDYAQFQDMSAVVLVRKKKFKKSVVPLIDLSGKTYSMQAKELARIVDDWNVSKLIYDKGGRHAEPVITELKKMIPTKMQAYQFKSKGIDKIQFLRNIKAACQQNEFEILKTSHSDRLIKELIDFDLANPKFRQYKKGGHQDFLAALMLAWSEIKKPRRFGQLALPLRQYGPSLSERGSQPPWGNL